MSSQPDAALLVGPLLRWLDETSATVWVETSRACEVTVLRQSQPTFSVAGHHYALVVLQGLQPGTRSPYEVHLDGRLVWPPHDGKQPASVIATRSPNERLRLAFGSCRVAGPREMPLGIARLLRRYDPDLDALAAFAERLSRLDHAEWPDLLLLMGDQVYADDVPRSTRLAMVDRRGGNVPESGSVSDFEDYTRLYFDSWTEPTLRWLYSTLPSAMIFDDHELVDNWDISAAWVAEKRATPGWDARLTGALMSYWIYQHLGNLSPDELATDRLYQGVLSDGDGSERLRTHLREYDSDHTGSRWAYRRDFDDVRLLVLDTRATRVLEEGQRDMLDPAEWRWLEDNIAGARHLLIASSVPVVYALGFHQLQAWSERVAAGLWGPRAAGFAERARRMLSLSGWPSFGDSFSRLMSLLGALGAGRLGPPPRSITLLSGDVHHGYVARLRWPLRDGVRSTVHQVVTSPFRNPLMPHERLAQRFAASIPGAYLLGLLARSAGVPPVDLRWRRLEGIDFANEISTLNLDDGGVELHTEAAAHVSAGDGRAAGHTPGRLRTLWRRRLA